MRKLDARYLSSDAQEVLRRRAVRAVRGGMSQSEAARTFGVSRQSVNTWVRRCLRRGIRGLETGPRGRPRGGSLRPWQAAQIVRAIEDRCPDQLKLPFWLWTREAVGRLIRKRFGVKLSVWTVGRYLERWGFTPQKPVRRAFECNPEAVRRWLKREYPAIRREAKRRRAAIYWGDEMGLRSDHAVGRTYGRRGRTPEVPGTGRRFGCNLISAITNRGRLSFMVFREKFAAGVFLKFLKRLVKQAAGRRIFLIVDGHPVHRSRKVQAWLKRNHRFLRVFFLPGYSPDLNPDEELNQDVKSNAVGRRRPRDQREMMASVRGYLWGRQRQPQVVRHYFQEEHVRYAAV